MWSLIVFLIVGLIAGFFASRIMGARDDLLMMLLIGMAGAIVGGILGWLLGLAAFNIIGRIILATIGAVICLSLWRRFAHNRRGPGY